jgi:hypothetical protein
MTFLPALLSYRVFLTAFLITITALLTGCDNPVSPRGEASPDLLAKLDAATFPAPLQESWTRIGGSDRNQILYDFYDDHVEYWIWDLGWKCYWTGTGELLGREEGYLVIQNPNDLFHTRVAVQEDELKLSNYVQDGDFYRFVEDVYLEKTRNAPAPQTEANKCPTRPS